MLTNITASSVGSAAAGALSRMSESGDLASMIRLIGAKETATMPLRVAG
jgi:hypothetical protein